MKVNFRAGSIDPIEEVKPKEVQSPRGPGFYGLAERTVSVSGSYGFTNVGPITSHVDDFYVVPMSGSYRLGDLLMANPEMFGIPRQIPVNQGIARQEGYWHCGSNWSLGHTPTPTENVLFDRYAGTCLVHGDVNILDLNIADNCHVRLNICSGVVFIARQLNLGVNSICNWRDCTINVSNGIFDRGEAERLRSNGVGRSFSQFGIN